VFVPIWCPAGSEVSEDQLKRTRQELAAVLARDTGQTRAAVLAELDGGRSLSPAEALAWGIVDRVEGLADNRLPQSPQANLLWRLKRQWHRWFPE
jgi:hypothetical protein